MTARMQIHLENQEAVFQILKEAGRKPELTLKKASNEAAREARERLYGYIRREYTAKAGRFPKRSLAIKRASGSDWAAWITVSHPPQSLRESYSSRKNSRRQAAKAAVYRKSLKPVEGKGLKGFVAEMENGHTGIFQRVPGAFMKKHRPRPYKRIPGRMTKGREAIREAIGPSGAKLTEMAFLSEQDTIRQSLKEALWRFMDQAF